MIEYPWYDTVVNLLLTLLAGCIALTGILFKSPWRNIGIALILFFLCLLALVYWLFMPRPKQIYPTLTEALGLKVLQDFEVFTKTFPSYRFVDIFEAVDRLAKSFTYCEVLEAQNDLPLNSIVQRFFYSEEQKKLSSPSKMLRSVDYHEEHFYPNDQFWAVAESKDRKHPTGLKIIFRVRYSDYSRETGLEIAINQSAEAERITSEIIKDSIANSIYRNKLLQISFDAGVKDEYGDVESGGEVQLAFKHDEPITREDIVLEEEIESVLKRNIFDFQKKRELLGEFGIPSKKGILFFGPPGTGKTYTCKYIYSNLENVTTMVVTGQSLLQVKSICNLAKMLQPSLLVLEDVDLIFTSREINLYSTALGDLMDELDGFQKSEAVTTLMTTNAIERLEEAIKDRPGRISQCIYFGHPDDELRKQYIEQYLKPYEEDDLDLDEVVHITKGASQAFIKELIYRAVQVSLERNPNQEKRVSLSTEDFKTANDEMKMFNAKATGSIMGFHPGT